MVLEKLTPLPPSHTKGDRINECRMYERIGPRTKCRPVTHPGGYHASCCFIGRLDLGIDQSLVLLLKVEISIGGKNAIPDKNCFLYLYQKLFLIFKVISHLFVEWTGTPNSNPWNIQKRGNKHFWRGIFHASMRSEKRSDFKENDRQAWIFQLTYQPDETIEQKINREMLQI